MSIGKIEPFNLQNGRWSQYIERFSQFVKVNKIANELKVAALLSVVGDETYELMCDLTHPERPADKTWDDLIKVITDHVQPTPSEIAERYKFRQRFQKQEESISEYVQTLKHLAKTCQFENQLEVNLRDQLVSGLRNDTIRSRLFTESNLTYAKAVELSLSLERAERDALEAGPSGGNNTGGAALPRPNHDSPASSPNNMYRQAGNPPEMANPRLPSLLSRQPPDPPDFIRPESRFPVYESPPRLPYEGQQFQQYPQHQPGWGRQVGQIAQPYADKNSHIFTHKDNGIQVADGQDLSPVQYGNAYNSRDYAKNPVIPPYYDTAYRPNLQQDNWKKDQDGNSRFSNINYSQERVNKDWRKDNKQEGIPDDQKIPQTPQKTTASDESAAIGNEKNVVAENPKHIQEKLAHELKHSSKTQANQVKQSHVESTKEPVIKIEKHVPAKPHEPFPDVVAFKIPESTDTEGVPHKSGAVLSLTLGLIITCIMAILLGCRLRVVRRRIRKGGKSYAHDADYLVNGMYL